MASTLLSACSISDEGSLVFKRIPYTQAIITRTDVMAVSSTEATTFRTQRDDAFGDDTVMILQLVLNDKDMPDIIECYYTNQAAYVSFDDMMDALAYPPTIAEDMLNMAAQHSSDHVSKPVTYYEQRPYIAAATMEELFSLRIGVQVDKMVLFVDSARPQPVEQHQNRTYMQSAKAKEQAKRQTGQRLSVAMPDYALFNWPIVDVSIDSTHQSETGQNRLNYSILSNSDLGYHNANIYASGDLADDTLSDFRFTLRQKDEHHDLFALHLSEYEAGDIYSVDLPLIAQTSLGRGIRFSNRDLARPAEFDSTNFTGDAIAGTEVEIYRNGVLLDTQIVGSDGRYDFQEVPILFGINEFRMVLYEPQGRIQERTEIYNAADTIVDEGRLVYHVSIDEKSETLLGISSSGIRPHQSGIRAIGSLEYGVSDWLTANAALVTTPLEDGMHHYALVGMRTAYGGLLGSANLAYDMEDGGYGMDVVAYGQYRGTNIQFRQQFLQDFISEETNNISNPTMWDTTIDMNRPFHLGQFGELNTGLTFSYEELESGFKEYALTNRLQKQLAGAALSNTLRYRFGDLQNEQLEGLFSIRKSIWGMFFGASVNYRMQPDEEIDRINANVLLPLHQDFTYRGRITKDLSPQSRTLYSNIVSWDHADHRVNLRADYDDRGEYVLGFGINMSFGYIPGEGLRMQSRPLSSMGNVVARAFMDDNNNHQLDDGEEYLDEAVFRVANRKTHLKETSGYGIATNIQPYRPIDVSLDHYALADPLWVSGVDAVEVTTRPGAVTHVDFPVIVTSELEGAVAIDGSNEQVRSIEVLLVNDAMEEIARVQTEYDGYFYFERVLPGRYFIVADPEQLDAHKLHQSDVMSIEITESDIYDVGYLSLETVM